MKYMIKILLYICKNINLNDNINNSLLIVYFILNINKDVNLNIYKKIIY